jgi:hypothetical protein
MEETDDVELRNTLITILQGGSFSFMSYIKDNGKPRISSVTLKYNSKLYQFTISDIKVIAEEPYKELKE